MKNTKVLAIHLPQFHRIPENDMWWGEGFTEWTNVKRGKPLYPGHYQPREPLNDNYYDLSDIRVLEEQIRLARGAGIYGFCFYHYYFCGKKLLEKPIEEYRNISKERFPYCLIWANQSWARTWYRGNAGTSILMKQSYGTEEAWKKHFYYLLDFFRDDRYIKINNKPVYIIYIPQDISRRRQMFSLWDNLAKKNGFEGIYLIAMNTGYGKDRYTDLYDSYMNFEPLSTLVNDYSLHRIIGDWKHQRLKENKKKKQIYINNEYSYAYLLKEIIKKSLFDRNKKNLYGLFSGWDNTPRKDEDGIVVKGCHPSWFYFAIRILLKISQKRDKEFIFINAWNEWSEGAYLEADKKFGYKYLNVLQKALITKEGKRR